MNVKVSQKKWLGIKDKFSVKNKEKFYGFLFFNLRNQRINEAN